MITPIYHSLKPEINFKTEHFTISSSKLQENLVTKNLAIAVQQMGFGGGFTERPRVSYCRK
jgi:hypothetical protein